MLSERWSSLDARLTGCPKTETMTGDGSCVLDVAECAGVSRSAVLHRNLAKVQEAAAHSRPSKPCTRRAPDAVFCVNDLMAFGPLDLLGDVGLKVPDNVSIIGFDDERNGGMGLIPSSPSCDRIRRASPRKSSPSTTGATPSRFASNVGLLSIRARRLRNRQGTPVARQSRSIAATVFGPGDGVIPGPNDST